MGYVVFRKLAWDLADEVFDCGTHLLFRKGSKEQKVILSEVINVNIQHFSSPERVTLHTRNEGSIGTELVFSLPIRINLFSKPKIVAELIQRIDDAKSSKRQ